MNQIQSREHITTNYDKYYESGDSEWRRIGAVCKVDNIISLCADLPKASVLEIGAGEGSILKRLSELNFGEQLYALEISNSGVETIRNKKISRLMECQIFDGYHMPYDDDRFDIAILSHVLEHVEHPRQLLYEASRVAKYLFVEVPLEDNLRLPRDFVFDKVGHINFYSPKTIRQLVQSCSLNVLSQKISNPSSATYTFRNKYKGLLNYGIKGFLLSLFPRLATIFFTYRASLVCTKTLDVN